MAILWEWQTFKEVLHDRSPLVHVCPESAAITHDLQVTEHAMVGQYIEADMLLKLIAIMQESKSMQAPN